MKNSRDTRGGASPPAIKEYLEAPLRRPLLVIVPAVLVTLGGIAGGFLLPER